MRWNRREVLGGLAAPLLAQKKKPNVLFVLTDEWRAQATSYNGDTNVTTPVLDRFAAQSVSFDTAVSGTPVCSPYRGSLLTGQYPLTNGLYVNDVPLEPKGPTMGEVFTRAGYRTGYIGKWHVYGSPGGKNERRLDYIPPDKRFGFDYWKACECTHEYNQSIYYEGKDTQAKTWPGYDAMSQSEDACGFLEKQAKGRDPFCLVLSLGPPHFPLHTAPAPYQAMYKTRAIALRDNVPEEKRNEAIAGLRGYYAHMAALDDCLSKLLETLERTRLAEDTIVVFTSDHGDMMQSQGLTTKLYPWDESIRVPFLVRYPRKLGTVGKRVKTPVNAPDILPTLLGLCEVKIPDSVEGTNHTALLEGKRAENLEQGTLLSLPVPITEARRYGFAEYRGLRTARHTYVRSVKGPWLLYDNVADPYQKRNLIGKAEAKELEGRLSVQLDAELKRRKDDFLPAARYVERIRVGHYQEVNTKVGRHVSPWGDWESTM